MDQGQTSTSKPFGDYWFNTSPNGKPSYANSNFITKEGTVTQKVQSNSSGYYEVYDGANFGLFKFNPVNPTASFNTLISIDKPIKIAGYYQALWARGSTTTQFPVKKPDENYLSLYLPGFYDFVNIPFDTGSWRMNVLEVAGGGGTTYTMRSCTDSGIFISQSVNTGDKTFDGFDNYGGLDYFGTAANSWGYIKAMLYYNRQLTSTELNTIFSYYNSFGYFDS
jgi:hypothetical protein